MIDLHVFEKSGENFVFFPRSARLYQLSEAAAVVLREISVGPGKPGSLPALPGLPLAAAPEQGELDAELRALMQMELEVPSPSAPHAAGIEGENSFRTFSLYLAQSCNMDCCYCWNRGGSFGKKPRLMGRKKAQLVADLIVSLAESSSAEKIFVNFYGGEPLLNFAALENITLELRRQEARLDKNFSFSLDTNGSLLEGKAAQFLARHFSRVGVSLDGRQEIHDAQRPGTAGECTWQKVVDNVQAFPNPKVLTLRGTLTALSDSYLDTFRQLSTLGVRRIQLAYCHDTGYHGDPGYGKLIVPPERQIAELSEFLDDYIEIISRFRDPGAIPFVSDLLDRIIRFRRGDRFTRPCGAGMNELAINSQGEIFPCIAFADREDFAMGRVGTDGCLPLQQTLTAYEVDDRLSCHCCWLRYDCAGGCFATHHSMTGHSQQPHPQYCRNMRSKAEIYLHAMAQMLKKCPWHLDPASG
jgi:uncharacterized protein